MLRFVGFVCLFCLLWRVAWLSWLSVGLVWCVCGWLIGYCILCLVLSGCLWFSCGCVGAVLSFGLVCCWGLGLLVAILVDLVQFVWFLSLFGCCLDLVRW